MTYKLCDSEYRFMQVVWDAAPVSSPALVELCQEKLGWKKSTTYTVLKKLCGKGLLKNENTLVSVLAPRETVTAEAAEDFVEKAFSGSLPSFLTAFMGGRTLSNQEAEELKRLIDAHREGAQ
ncbi:BlaI/MecI/CopY family transcriptional regulator [Oscillibacter ruminantium]|uniref:BlaI/MecI/CopY family transcriptional regulator n=1 Tax=Oscillibacter ruminantium TaxID=1263547 RepID=UPI0002D8EA94|nr:BlaI/MecI/CopY family transcriptional regulator [Oscillibacter ruminantium]MDN0033847.1 BlaI/MecI/CopY family transcriptional regulator [Oscillibacter valericigenes]